MKEVQESAYILAVNDEVFRTGGINIFEYKALQDTTYT